jgi:uncharacterized protein YegP (UPF0339 family)
MPAQYKLKQSSDGQYYFNLTAANNETILTSERYKSKDGAKNGIESVRTNSPDDSRYDRLTASNGKPYFVLKAANQQTIGKSETYSSKQAMENGISAVKGVGPTAPINDQT